MKRQKRLRDGGVSSAENDAWLRDWSENVRTNKTLETCAGFRERKLRPFLLKEMDPEGKATSFVNGGKTALIETDAHAQVLNATKSGRLRFNGTSVRLLSLKVRCP